MLEIMRRGAASWVAKILFVLLIVSFGAWGIGDFVKPDTNRSVATVGGAKVSPQEFNDAYRQEFERLSQRFGGRLTRELANQFGLPQQVLNQIITRRTVDAEAKRLGITVSEEQVRAQVHSNPAFRGASGSFEYPRFLQLLQQAGMSEAGYVSAVRQEMILQQLAGAVVAAAPPPDSYANALYAFREEQRTATLMLVPHSAIGGIAEPTDAELAAYHEANKDRFMAPEYRALTVLVVNPDDMAAGIKPTDAEIQAAYAARNAEFKTAGTREVQQLLFTDEAAAREAQAALAEGKSLDEVAEAAKAKGGERSNLGRVKRGELFPKSVEDAAFALAAPGATPPVQTPLGWHVLVVANIEAERERPLAEVRDQIVRDLTHEAAVEKLRGMANQIEDELAGGGTLEEAGQKLGVAPVKIAATDRNGTAPDGNSVESLIGKPYVIAAAFDAAEGQETPIGDTPENGLFSVRVDKVTPSVVKPLEAVRSDVAQAWRAERVRDRARELAEAYAERVRKGESLAAVAEDAKMTVKTSPAVKRNANQPADWLPAPVTAKLFETPLNGVFVAATQDGPVVGVVASVERPDPAAAKDAVQQVRDSLAGALAADVEIQFNKALQDRIGVTVDQAALQRAM